MANPKYELTIHGTTFRFLEDVKKGDERYTLETLSYDKGIYRPAEIMATMTVSGSPQYEDLVKAFSKKPVSLKIDGNEVAKSYFVFKVKPEFRKVATQTSVSLELIIYSQDKLMTLDKYSKAWTGQRLGRDVLANEMGGFKLEGKNTDYCFSMQLLDYGANEFMHPYLVQYNESLYDFLRRTTNRCGEFLYHEDGELHLGVKLLTDHENTDYAKIASHRYYEDILREGTDTSDYNYNYLKSHANPSARPYSDPLAYDDYLDDINKELTSTKVQMGKWNKNLVSSICMALEGTSYSKIIANIGLTCTFKAIKAAIAASDINACYLTENITPFSGNPDHENAQDQIRQFGTATDRKVSIDEGPIT